MKRLLLFVTAVMILAACGSGSDSSSRKKKERFGWSGQTLYGDVKSVTKEQYVLEGEFGAETLGQLIERKVYLFDQSHGNCLEHIWEDDFNYEYNTHRTFKFVYSYDSTGNCIEYKYYVNETSETPYITTFNTYDSKGNLIECKDYNNIFDTFSKHIYTYDSKGNCNEYRYYNEDELVFRSVRTYDSNGNCLEDVRYDVGGEIIWKYTFRFDSDGNEIESNYYNSTGVLEQKMTHVFNSEGKWIEKNVFGSDGNLVQKGGAAYDDEGNRIVELFDSYGEPIKKYIISYDSHKNQRESKNYTNIAGVWIPESIIKYEIEYFE